MSDSPETIAERMNGGNGAKMREALEFLIKHKEWLRGYSLTMTLEDLEITDRILGKAEAALAAPPRNCDVGTADGQTFRFRDGWERANGEQAPQVGLHLASQFSRWAQMPYEEGGAK